METPTRDEKLIDDLLGKYGHRSEDIVGENGLLKQLTKALVERAMRAELSDHLGYEKHDRAGEHSGNSRNGTSKKKLKGESSASLTWRRLGIGTARMSRRSFPSTPDPMDGIRRQDRVDV